MEATGSLRVGTGVGCVVDWTSSGVAAKVEAVPCARSSGREGDTAVKVVGGTVFAAVVIASWISKVRSSGMAVGTSIEVATAPTTGKG